MISVYISYGNETTEEWESICTIPLKPYSELYPDELTSDDSWGVIDFEFSLPNQEKFKFSAAFTEASLGISLGVSHRDKFLISVHCYKKDLNVHDPSVIFQSPKGLNVSIMFGPLT